MTSRRSVVTMPRVNANDDSGRLVRWIKSAGEAVHCGELIAQIETSKAAVDLEADADGFLHPLAEVGASVPVGEALAWIVDSYDANSIAREIGDLRMPAVTEDRLISRKARDMMAATGLSAAEIPGDGPIGEHQVQQLLDNRRGRRAASVNRATELAVTDRSIILIGAAKQGVVVLDCLREGRAYDPLCFIDEKPSKPELEGLPVFEWAALDILSRRGIKFVHICIGAPEPKLRLAKRLKELGFTLISAIHPRAVISASAELGEGVYIGPGAVVGPCAVIGAFSQVNNNATVPHHVRLGVAVRVSDGANIAGDVVIGDRSYLGLGVTVNTDCHIGADVTVVSGVSVFDAVPDGAVVRGPNIRK